MVTVGPGWMSWMMITWTEVVDEEEDELEELDEELPEPPAAEPEEPPEEAPDPEPDDEEELDDDDELEDPDPEPGAGAGGAGAGAVPTEGEVDCGGASGSVTVVLIPLMFSVIVAIEVTTDGGLLATTAGGLDLLFSAAEDLVTVDVWAIVDTFDCAVVETLAGIEATDEADTLAGVELATPPAVTVIVDFSAIVSFSVTVTVA
jgi:hypothetical protein